MYDEDGLINRHYYEMAALTELRNHIRSGDISVVGSRQHKDFDEYLVSKQEWVDARTSGIRLAVSLSPEEYLQEIASGKSIKPHFAFRMGTYQLSW